MHWLSLGSVLNALYDILSESFVDCILEKGINYNEAVACCQMVDKIKTPSIVICDRNYENYNLFAHLSKARLLYVIRLKDKSANRGIASYWWKKLDGPEDDGEVLVKTRITRINSKAIKESTLYHFFPKTAKFDFIPTLSPFKQGRKKNILPEDISPEYYHEISFRLVRFRINPPGSENEFETIATNLPENDFPAEEIKKLYHLRWSIETGLRELKYDELLSKLHSVKVDSVCKEVYIAFIMHNITAYLLSSIVKKKGRKEFVYEASHSDASHAVRLFLGRKNRDGPRKLMQELARNMEPIRDDRSFPRQLIHKGFIAFTYRAA